VRVYVYSMYMHMAAFCACLQVPVTNLTSTRSPTHAPPHPCMRVRSLQIDRVVEVVEQTLEGQTVRLIGKKGACGGRSWRCCVLCTMYCV
jgi:hypothetical protein